MTRITKTAKSTMVLAASAVASVLIAGSVSTPANADTIYFGYEVSFREAKQMCNGMHGRIFETERAQYGCTGDLREPKAYKRPPPSTHVPQSANDRPSKRQNFTGRKDFTSIGKTGGEGGGTGGGNGGGGGGSAGGHN